VANRKRFSVSLLGAVLILFLASSVGPDRDTTTSGPETATVDLISEIGKVFGVSDASAKTKKKRKHARSIAHERFLQTRRLPRSAPRPVDAGLAPPAGAAVLRRLVRRSL
jgi:hypothetical protein